MLIVRKDHGRAAAPVAESWRRIEAWLDNHLPAVKSTLRPGVSKKHLAKFETFIGRSLPEDVRESWLIHDGQRPVPADDDHDLPDSEELLYGYALNPLFDAGDRLSLDSVFSCWRYWMTGHGGGTKPERSLELDRGHTSSPAGAIRPCQFHAGWLPLATLVDNDYLGIDLDPGPDGTAGQVINFGAKVYDHFVLATSWAQFLADFADELEAGNVVRDPEERVREIQMKEPAGYLLGNERAWSHAKLGSRLRGRR
jgi:cell wall assembly regulator SMI1